MSDVPSPEFSMPQVTYYEGADTYLGDRKLIIDNVTCAALLSDAGMSDTEIASVNINVRTEPTKEFSRYQLWGAAYDHITNTIDLSLPDLLEIAQGVEERSPQDDTLPTVASHLLRRQLGRVVDASNGNVVQHNRKKERTLVHTACGGMAVIGAAITHKLGGEPWMLPLAGTAAYPATGWGIVFALYKLEHSRFTKTGRSKAFISEFNTQWISKYPRLAQMREHSK